MALAVHLQGVLFVSLFIYIPVSSQGLIKTADNYGPYIPRWLDYGTCQGPKSKNLGNYTTYLTYKDNCTYAVLNMTLATAVVMEDVKLEVFSLKNNKKSVLWNYRISKPCQHYAVSAAIEKFFGANNCIFKKGDHYYQINLTETCYKYFGTSFFYGEFIFKLITMSKKGNLTCVVFRPIFSKKT